MAVKLRISTAACTDVGLVRTNNEDNYFVDEEHYVFAVADGMGGHAAGEVASKIAVDTLREIVEKYRGNAPPDALLSKAISIANKKILDEARKDPSKRGMGTTLSILMFEGEKYYIGHIGDSRIYLYRDGKLKQLTFDHTLANEMRGQLSPSDYERYSHILTRSLGQSASVFPHVTGKTAGLYPGLVRQNDIFLLCSDGLYDMVDDEKIHQLIELYKNDLNTLCHRLIEEAKKNGGKDNITVVLVRIDEIGNPSEKTEYPMEDTLEIEEQIAVRPAAEEIKEKYVSPEPQYDSKTDNGNVTQNVPKPSKSKMWIVALAIALLSILLLIVSFFGKSIFKTSEPKKPEISNPSPERGERRTGNTNDSSGTRQKQQERQRNINSGASEDKEQRQKRAGSKPDINPERGKEVLSELGKTKSTK